MKFATTYALICTDIIVFLNPLELSKYEWYYDHVVMLLANLCLPKVAKKVILNMAMYCYSWQYIKNHHQ